MQRHGWNILEAFGCAAKKMLDLQQSWQEPLSECGAASGKSVLQGGQYCWRIMVPFFCYFCNAVLSGNRNIPVEFLRSPFDVWIFAVLVDAAILDCCHT